MIVGARQLPSPPPPPPPKKNAAKFEILLCRVVCFDHPFVLPDK